MLGRTVGCLFVAARVDLLQLRAAQDRSLQQTADRSDRSVFRLEELTGNLFAKCRQFEEDIDVYERRMARTWVATT